MSFESLLATKSLGSSLNTFEWLIFGFKKNLLHSGKNLNLDLRYFSTLRFLFCIFHLHYFSTLRFLFLIFHLHYFSSLRFLFLIFRHYLHHHSHPHHHYHLLPTGNPNKFFFPNPISCSFRILFCSYIGALNSMVLRVLVIYLDKLRLSFSRSTVWNS